MNNTSNKSDKFRESYSAFCYEAEEKAIDTATSAAPQECCVELFAGGKYRTCYYKSHGKGSLDCLTLRIPPLTDDDHYEGETERYYGDRTEELRLAFELACRVYDQG